MRYMFKKFKLAICIALLSTMIFNSQVANAYGKNFYLRPYTINSPVSTSDTMRKIDLDAAVVTINYGYVPGASLDFSVRHSNRTRATYGFTAGGNYRHYTNYMPGQAKIGSYYRLFSSFYDPNGTQGTTTGGRWAP